MRPFRPYGLALAVLLCLAGPTNSCAQAPDTLQLPERMYPDTLHAPFRHGVASGDPLQDRVIIWTRITPDSAGQPPLTVDWAVAADSNFNNVVNTGSFTTDSSRDWTVKVDVGGLAPGSRYYYRFRAPSGAYSATGRTQTVPQGGVRELRFGVVSCSSIFSGFFNAYRQLGRRDDLDLIIHLGDYIYDFIDPDEEVRVPQPTNQAPQYKAEWRNQHEYYLNDPDLRYARARHPFMVMWDNHDTERGNDSLLKGSMEAFREWVPVRKPDSSDWKRNYRRVQYGQLADIYMLDMLHFREPDSVPDTSRSILGDEQYNWFIDHLKQSPARWHIVGSQKLVTQWAIPDIIGIGTLPFNDASWDGIPADRLRWFRTLRKEAIDNTIALSGDTHLSIAADLTATPYGPGYNPGNGDGAVGVEFAPTSISRGNYDELSGLPVGGGVAENLSMQANPHHQYSEFVRHGYGILQLRPDSSVAQYWYCPIREVTDEQEMGQELVVQDGANHWQRPATSRAPAAKATEAVLRLGLRPNPAREAFTIRLHTSRTQQVTLMLYDMSTGRKLRTLAKPRLQAGQPYQQRFERQELAAGPYMIVAQSERSVRFQRLMLR